MDVTVPVGSNATVYVPAKNPDNIKESGNSSNNLKGVKFEKMNGGYAVYSVGSGKYYFEIN